MGRVKMGKVKTLVQILPIIVDVGILFKLMVSSGEAFPVDRIVAEERMIKPPRFPYDPPYGYHTSGILCIFSDLPYLGGWAGRSCAGPVPPFIMPTPPSTTAAPPAPTPAPTTASTTTKRSTTQPTPYYHYPNYPTVAAGTGYQYPSYPMAAAGSSQQYPNYPMAAAGSSLSYNSYLPYPYPMMPYYHTDEEHNPNLYADYGDPVEGNPWEPDDDDIFIESYGVRAGRSGFRMGDPHRNRHE